MGRVFLLASRGYLLYVEYLRKEYVTTGASDENAEADGAIDKRDRIAADLIDLIGKEGVVAEEAAMSPFESDGLNAYRQTPLVVALPADTAEVAKVLSYCQENQLKIVPRGAGTSLSGGALPLADGVLLGLSRMNRILDIDYENRAVVAQPGVTNLSITTAVEGRGFYYAPDPSSQIACSIGGNVAGKFRRRALPQIRADHQ